MKIVDLRYDEIENYLETNDADVEEIKIELPEFGGSGVVIADAVAYRVVDKGLIFMSGVFCNYVGSGEFDPDFDLTLIYTDVSDDAFDPSEYVYYEQDSAPVAIHNFRNAISRPGKR